MITKPVTGATYAAACQYNPPPLHVYSTDAEAANWYPAPRPQLTVSHHPGPVMIRIPIAAPWGDDPADKGNQTVGRMRTNGMIGRFNVQGYAS